MAISRKVNVMNLKTNISSRVISVNMKNKLNITYHTNSSNVKGCNLRNAIHIENKNTKRDYRFLRCNKLSKGPCILPNATVKECWNNQSGIEQSGNSNSIADLRRVIGQY